MTPDEVLERLDRAIFEIQYPPLHPELTKDDVLQLLKDARYFIASGAKTPERKQIDEAISAITNKLYDIDSARREIEDLLDEL